MPPNADGGHFERAGNRLSRTSYTPAIDLDRSVLGNFMCDNA